MAPHWEPLGWLLRAVGLSARPALRADLYALLLLLAPVWSRAFVPWVAAAAAVLALLAALHQSAPLHHAVETLLHLLS